ncbi:ferrous iron transport protein B [Ferrimonas gelatinilytica]|uniref:Ferrous iron transport protein B n=1 Tax=Ferrimonas gelatinilytica TaxID=1255257 RepID=A0ABP9SEJ7_9GAMM
MNQSVTILSVGLPNSGKSTLFNGLTNGRAKVGNWAGVTVAQSAGSLMLDECAVSLLDLPGFYDLTPVAGGPEDELVSQRALSAGGYQGILNVVDATQLERHLYLTLQLRELGVPMVVALNKWDSACAQGMGVDLKTLEQRLGCPVVALSARTKQGIVQAREALEKLLRLESLTPLALPYGEPVARRLQGESPHTLAEGLSQDSELLMEIAACRHRWIGEMLAETGQRLSEGPSLTERLDRWILHPLAGVPIFLLMMYLTFMFAIHMGSAFIDFFDIMAGALFVDGAGMLYSSIGFPDWLVGLLANGVGMGIQTVATFVPVVAFLYFALGILETSGYLARAAFVVEGLMNKLGLPGKAFVPLIVGFGCNVPAISATRTLELRRQRIMTSMMAPFMSCGARLPVYALFAAAFFQNNGQNLVFLLYLIGIVAAMLTGLVLRFTLLPGRSGNAVMEMPDYECPSLRMLLSRTWFRTRQFVLGAGKVIVVVVTLLSFVNTLGVDGTIGHDDSEQSVLAVAAKAVTPVLSPMGIEQDNWPATVGIITGLFAKEAVVGTLSSLYGAGEDEATGWDLWATTQEALATIPDALLGIDPADPLGMVVGDLHQVDAVGEAHGFEASSLGNLAVGFGSQAAAMAYLLFILLYTPCAAVLGTIANEIGGRWALFSAGWTLSLAYASAVVYYQLATRGMAGLPWLGLMAGLFALLLIVMRRVGKQHPVGDIPVKCSYGPARSNCCE